ncbi:MAG TPA: phosphoribosylaminoimidazolesuccinocarboxamide synthase [Gemmatimonadota bacterium]|nr:phosphoribosylaminoimidazolesuccinocarboxamide synthase [Gemmatimonadota bacterium]
MSSAAITGLALPLPLLHRGKVREMYALDGDVLMVATDRLSAFDIVFEEGIPEKGRVLNGLSDFWFGRLSAARPHHRITAQVDAIAGRAPALEDFRDDLAGRAMLCRRCAPLPVECIVRGYLDGSAWSEYRMDRTVAGLPLPAGLERGAKLPEPIFTPATKAVTGHDENIPCGKLEEIVGKPLAAQLRQRSLELYAEGSAHAAERGLILADTKFEFGWGPAEDGTEPPLLLIDEVLTPDSSRFWRAAEWAPGGAQPSLDKQPIRDFLEAERAAGRWNGEPPLPPLHDSAVRATTERYLEAYRRLTDRALAPAP